MENELKQVGGRTSLQTTEVFQVLAVKEGRKRGSEEGLNSVRKNTVFSDPSGPPYVKNSHLRSTRKVQ